MFSKLKKLWQGEHSTEVVHPASLPTAVQAAPCGSAFLCRETVFDQHNRPAGHLFRLQQSTAPADASDIRQGQFDQILLDTLNASPEAWNTSLAFIPLNSNSLDFPAVDRLQRANLVLLVHLAGNAEPDRLLPRLQALRQRGLAIGIFRQPQNPAFTEAICCADFGVIDVCGSEAVNVRDFSAALRSAQSAHPVSLFACNIDTLDEHLFCRRWEFDYFHGQYFASATGRPDDGRGDPHKGQLLHLLRLVQGDAETAEIAHAMKADPLLAFRVLRYLNSPLLGLNHHIESLDQALIVIGRQRLTRWLAVLLFSAHEPNFGDWLMIESALTRGHLMEVLGSRLFPGEATDPLFLTGIFSCLDRLLRRPLSAIIDELPVSGPIRAALLERSGPYAPLLAVAEASEAFDLPRMESTAITAGLDPDTVNRALLAATAWASEITAHWE